MNIIWVGKNPYGQSYKRLKSLLSDFGFQIKGKWETLRDINEKARPHIFLCVGSGPMTARMMGISKKSGIPVFMPAGTTPGAAIRCLKDNGLITNENRPAALYGFHDEKEARKVNPVTAPLIGEEEAEKMRSRLFGDKRPVWVVDGNPMVSSNKKLARPVIIGGKFYESSVMASKDLGVGPGNITAGLYKGKSEFRGIPMRRATLDEVMKNLPGAFRDVSRDVTTPKKPFKYKIKDGKPYSSGKAGRYCRPVTIENETFKSVGAAAAFLEINGGTMTGICKGRSSLEGYDIHYASVDEFTAAFPEAELEQNPVVVARSKKVATPPIVVIKHGHNSRLKKKLAEIVSSDKSDEAKLATVDALLDYSEETGRLTNKLREIINGKHALIKIEALLDYDSDQ